MNKEPLPLTTRHKVRSYELDAYGIVNNANYLNYFEYARGDYILQKGLGLDDFTRLNTLPRVVRVTIHFKQPAFVENVLRIDADITRWRHTSFTMHYEITNETTNTLTAVADMELAFVNNAGKPVAIAEEFRTAFSRK